MAVFSSCISSWISSSIWTWVAHIVWASLVQFWIKLCVWTEVCNATPVTAAVVQIAVNPQMPRISHPMNRLDHRSSFVSIREASPAMGPSSQGSWRFIRNHRLCGDRRLKRDSFLKEVEVLRQVYSLQFIQVTEYKVLLNCKLPIAPKLPKPPYTREGNTGLYDIWLIITKEMVSMTTIGPCEMSSPSPKFFGAHRKFPDVPLFRPNLFIEDDWRTRGCHSTVKPAKKSFVLVMFHCSVSDLWYLSSTVTHSAVDIIWAVR